MAGDFPDHIVRVIALERADAARRALEDALNRIQMLEGNEVYQKAFKVAVHAIRTMLMNVR